MQVTSKGQVTIPKHLRDYAGILPNSEVEFVLENGEIKLRLAAKKAKDKGTQIVEHLLKFKGNGLTASQIMQMTRE